MTDLRKAAEPVAWGLPGKGGILDVISPEEHARAEGGYTVPLFTAAPDATRLTTDRTAVVDGAYRWREIDDSTPKGVKLQLIRQGAGVAIYGTLGTSTDWFTHWAPLPTFRR
jgi:hypothetical protein